MKVLLTGGSLGQTLVPRLLDPGDTPVILDVRAPRALKQGATFIACQREERADRFRRRAAKLNRQLGGEGWDTWETRPDKPKWMRCRTYETKLKVWEEAVEKANTELIARAMMGLKRR